MIYLFDYSSFVGLSSITLFGPEEDCLRLRDRMNSMASIPMPACATAGAPRSEEVLGFAAFQARMDKASLIVVVGDRPHETEDLLLSHGYTNLVCAALLEDTAHPTFVVEVTTVCNLKCMGCVRTIRMNERGWENGHMSLETFARVVAHLPPACNVVLQGVGEPTLTPRFSEFVRCARKSGSILGIHTTTNGLATAPEYFAELVDCGLTSLSISIDSMDPVTASKVRSGTEVDRLDRLLRYITKLALPLNIAVVVSRFNVHEIPELLTTLDAYGPFGVTIQPYQDLGDPSGCLDAADRDRVRSYEQTIIPRLRNIHVSFNNSLNTTPAALCKAPWQCPGINRDGFLTPCCCHWASNLVGQVDLKEVDLATAWKTLEFQAFLNAYVRRAPAYCEGCEGNPRASERSKAGGRLERIG